MATTDEREDMRVLCPACVAVLGACRPDRFPTAYELEEAERRYPEPIFPTEEEWSDAAIEDEDAYEAGYLSSFISRAELSLKD